MTFQPFGFPFELRAAMTVDSAKAAIRAERKGWFEPKNGPRGWIVGPFLCLWNSAFDRYGPMVIATIRDDGSGTRIAGRAGSNLNGVLTVAAISIPMVALIGTAWANGEVRAGALFTLAIIFGLGLPLTLWLANKDKRDAEPLIRFLRRTLNLTKRVGIRSESVSTHAAVSVNDAAVNVASSDDLHRILTSAATGDAIILAFADETYLQALANDDRFIVEKREGSDDRHFGAELAKGGLGDDTTFDENLARLVMVMADYLNGRPPRQDLAWRRIDV